MSMAGGALYELVVVEQAAWKLLTIIIDPQIADEVAADWAHCQKLFESWAAPRLIAFPTAEALRIPASIAELEAAASVL